MNAGRPFGALDYDQPETDSWRWNSLALLLVTSAIYWALTWIAAGFPPLVSLASGLRVPTERR